MQRRHNLDFAPRRHSSFIRCFGYREALTVHYLKNNNQCYINLLGHLSHLKKDYAATA